MNGERYRATIEARRIDPDTGLGGGACTLLVILLLLLHHAALTTGAALTPQQAAELADSLATAAQLSGR